jgi:hypothetical protein
MKMGRPSFPERPYVGTECACAPNDRMVIDAQADLFLRSAKQGRAAMTRYNQRGELAAIVHKTIRSRPLGDVFELAHAIIDDIEDAGWTIVKTGAAPI